MGAEERCIQLQEKIFACVTKKSLSGCTLVGWRRVGP